MNSSTIYTKDLDHISSFSYTSKHTTTNKDVTLKSTTSTKNYPCVVAINEYRNRQEVGIAKISILNLSVTLCQYADPISTQYNKTLILLRDHQHDDVIYPSNLDGFPLIEELRRAGINLKSYDKKKFNFNDGMRILENYGINNLDNVLAITSLAANFHFLSNTKRLVIDGLRFDISIEKDYNNVFLNPDCIKLICSRGGLFEAINKCKTPQGARLLKTTMTNPPSLQQNIGENKIEKYIKQIKSLNGQTQTGNILEFYSDMEKVVLYFLFPLRLDSPSCAKNDILNVLTLYKKFTEIETLNNILNISGIQEFGEEFIEEVTKIKAHITKKINTKQNCTSKNIRNDLYFLVKESHNEDGLLSKAREKLEQIEHQIKLTKNIRYSKDHRASLLALRKQLKTEILLLSQLTIRDLREILRSVVSGIGMGIIRKISELDFLYNGYIYCEELVEYYKRENSALGKSKAMLFPKFIVEHEKQKLLIKKGRHPLLISSGSNAVPNTFDVNTIENGFILYGHNSSGKTTYMMQTVLLLILAMIGYPLPVECFVCSIDIRKIYTKFFNEEDTDTKLSSFGQECKDVAEITKGLNENTLLFIDEFGKGSNFQDGLSLSWAFIEKCVEKKCYWVVATHFKELRELKVGTKKVSIKSFDSIMNFTLGNTNKYNLQSGYGINMAQEMGLDLEIIKEALYIRNKLEK